MQRCWNRNFIEYIGTVWHTKSRTVSSSKNATIVWYVKRFYHRGCWVSLLANLTGLEQLVSLVRLHCIHVWRNSAFFNKAWAEANRRLPNVSLLFGGLMSQQRARCSAHPYIMHLLWKCSRFFLVLLKAFCHLPQLKSFTSCSAVGWQCAARTPGVRGF